MPIQSVIDSLAELLSDADGPPVMEKAHLYDASCGARIEIQRGIIRVEWNGGHGSHSTNYEEALQAAHWDSLKLIP
jgi:hypothetical protein